LALTRISSKIGINSNQIEMSISRLSAKNFVRKVYLQGNVGFELTPRGKQALEELAKAETARVTRQLQEAISQERKTKLRTNTVNKIILNEEKWQNYQVPDIKQAAEIELKTIDLLRATKKVAIEQPFCHKDTKNYDKEFSQYKPKIEDLLEQNNNFAKAVSNYAKIQNNLFLISADIENVYKTIKKYESLADASAQLNQLKAAFSRLKSVHSQMENFDKDLLTKFQVLKTQLAENFRLLETLKKPTHEFTPIKREVTLEKATRYPDPEGPIKYEHKTSGHPLEEKCDKCGTRRRSTPVDIG